MIFIYLQMLGVRQAVLASLPGLTRAVTCSRSLHVSRLARAVQVKMPSLSPTMEEGTIVKWTKVECSKYYVISTHSSCLGGGRGNHGGGRRL